MYGFVVSRMTGIALRVSRRLGGVHGDSGSVALPKTHYGWVILAVSVLTVLSSLGLARFGYTPILPSMKADLGQTNARMGLLATGNFVGYLAVALTSGFLVTRFSQRKVISASLFLVAISVALTATSRGFYSALFWRVLTGMGSGGSNVPVMGLLSSWFAPKRRGIATGIAVAGSSVGLIITGPLVVGILNMVGPGGWRLAWVILGGIILAIAVLAAVLLRNNPREEGLMPIGAEADAAKPASQPSTGNPHSWSLVYRSGIVWGLAMVYATFGFSYIIYLTFFSKYVEAIHTKEFAGVLWHAIGWISLSCGLIWGTVSDYLGRKTGLALVFLIQGAAYVIFGFWTSSAGMVVSVALFGITAWSIPGIMASACGDELGPKLAPAALGFVTLFFGIGQAIAPAVAGEIADAHGFHPAFMLAAVVAWVGAAGSLFLRHSKRAVG